MAKRNKRKRTEEQDTNPEEDVKSSTTSPCSKDTAKVSPQDGESKGKSKSNKAASMSGFDDIDDLFASKKERVKQEKQTQAEEERREMEKRKFFRQNNASTSSLLQNAKKKTLKGDKSDITGMKKNEWVDDGRGGVFDAEGFTGRKEDGVKVFKAHLFNKQGFGTTKDCPFDCDCCYI